MFHNLSTVLNAQFMLKKVPDSIPADIRPLWRVSLCLAILKYSRGGTASLKKLQVMAWALMNKRNYDLVLQAIESDIAKKKLIVRYDPALDRALDFAIGENLIEFTSSVRYKISEFGRKLVTETEEEGSSLEKELLFLKENGSKFSEDIIENLLDWNV